MEPTTSIRKGAPDLTAAGCSTVRDPRWDLCLERHQQLLAPYDADKAAARLRRYPSEESMFDPEYTARDGAIAEFMRELAASPCRYVVITSPAAAAQMQRFGFPDGERLLSRSVAVSSVHAGYLDGLHGRRYFEEVAALEPQPELVVAIGLGSVSDWSKLISHKFSADLIIIPSALSTNAAFTGNTVIRDEMPGGGALVHYTFIPHAAKKVIVDLGFIALNQRGNRAGIGDLLSSTVALRDWELAIQCGQERADAAVRADTLGLLERLAAAAPDICANRRSGLRLLADLNSYCSKLMTRFRSGRPKAGSEHILAENLERVTPGRRILHGEMIGVTNLVMAALYAEIDGDPSALAELRSVSQALGLNLDPDSIGFSRTELIAALTGTTAKPRRFSYFDRWQVSEEQAERVVRMLFP